MKTGLKYSIIIPVYREKIINDAVEMVKNLTTDKDYEIIVVDGEPEKSTLKLIRDKNVIKLSSEKGRGNQLNRGAEHAEGEILVFLHADTVIPENSLKLISEILSDSNINAGAFDAEIDSDNIFLKIISRGALFRSRLFRVPFGDQTHFFDKEYFDRIGGYKNIPLFEDVEIMKRIRKRKEIIHIFREKSKTSDRMWKKKGIIYTTIRNILLQLLYFFGVKPEFLNELYYR